MPPVPILSPSDVIKLFQHLGWEVVRQKGSHIIMTRPGHTTLPRSRSPITRKSPEARCAV